MNSIQELVQDIQTGKMVILVDDEARENEGDLILAADHVTPEAINFMATAARGLICLSLTTDQVQRLRLPMMVREETNFSPMRTAFTVSIEASSGVTTGISAADRCQTVKVASNPNSTPSDLITPGHVFPIRAQDGGVLKRAGHTEASVDLARLAGLTPAAVICEIMNTDGTMARVPELKRFAIQHGLKIGTIEDLIQYRVQTESFVHHLHQRPVILEQYGEFTMHVYQNALDLTQHFAFVKGQLDPEVPLLVRMHVENTLTDVFGLFGPGQSDSLKASFERICEEGRGVICYLRTAQAKISLNQESPMDERNYGLGAQILRHLGVGRIVLLTHRPTKRVGIKGYGLEIVEERHLKDERGLASEVEWRSEI